MQSNNSDSNIIINLAAIADNYGYFVGKVGSPENVAAVVKANAYGLCSEYIWRCLYEAGCRKFFVATLDEAIEVREAETNSKNAREKSCIYVFHGIRKGQEVIFQKYDIIPVINNEIELEIWASYKSSSLQKQQAIIHFDTGMNRLGFDWQEYKKVLNSELVKKIDVHYIMSHLSRIGKADDSFNQFQLDRFDQIKKDFPQYKYSIGNSKSVYAGKQYQYDLIRAGAGLYGVTGCYKVAEIKNPLKVTSKITQIRVLKQDETVGYGAEFSRKKGTILITIPLGYADGVFLRNICHSNFCISYKGYKLPIVGNVTMDMTMFDASEVGLDNISLYDDVEVVSDEPHIIDEIGAKSNTIGYEILTRLGRRVQRIYSDFKSY